MASNVPRMVLNNGKQIPILGLGTWNVSIPAYIIVLFLIREYADKPYSI